MILGKIWHKILHGKGIFMFMRSVVSSQFSSLIDIFISFILFSVAGLSAGISTASGAITGGLANLVMNYKFTFKMRECSYFAIGIKFLLVWVVCLLLNTFGTQWFTHWLTGNTLLDKLQMNDSLRFMVARISISVLVAVCWNFLMQRYFVFRSTKFDNFIDRCYFYCHAVFSKR